MGGLWVYMGGGGGGEVLPMEKWKKGKIEMS